MQKEESMEKMLKDVWKMRGFRYPNWWTNSIYLLSLDLQNAYNLRFPTRIFQGSNLNLVILIFSKSTFVCFIGLVGDQKLNKRYRNICVLSLEQQFAGGLARFIFKLQILKKKTKNSVSHILFLVTEWCNETDTFYTKIYIHFYSVSHDLKGKSNKWNYNFP